MQQTKHYKLNKPEMDDAFAVAPLNENADLVDAQLAALDGRVAGTDAKHCLIKLSGPVTVPKSGGTIPFDLPDGFCAGQYAALILVGTSSVSSTLYLTLNNGAGKESLQGSGKNMGFALLGPLPDGKTGLCSVYTCLGSTYRVVSDDGSYNILWQDITQLSLHGDGGVNSASFTLYGLKG